MPHFGSAEWPQDFGLMAQLVSSTQTASTTAAVVLLRTKSPTQTFKGSISPSSEEGRGLFYRVTVNARATVTGTAGNTNVVFNCIYTPAELPNTTMSAAYGSPPPDKTLSVTNTVTQPVTEGLTLKKTFIVCVSPGTDIILNRQFNRADGGSWVFDVTMEAL